MRSLRVPEPREWGLAIALACVLTLLGWCIAWLGLLWVLGMLWLLEKVGLL